MQCGKKSILTTIFVGILTVALVVVFFVAAFPLNSENNQVGLGAGGGSSADSTSLRGNAPESNNDGAFFVAQKEDSATESPTDIYYPFRDWDDLPEDIKEAALKLEYTKERWDLSEMFPIAETKWSELTREQKDAAKTIGYTKHDWNKDVVAITTANPTSAETTYAYYYAQFVWEDLPDNVRSAAQYIGYTESMWDTSTILPLRESEWNALTDTQRTAAETVGYDENLWNDATR